MPLISHSRTATAQFGGIGLRQPLLKYLISAEVVIPPDDGGNVVPVSPVVIQMLKVVSPRTGRTVLNAASPSTVYPHSSTLLWPVMTVPPVPKCPQPTVNAKSSPATFPPFTGVDAAIATTSGHNAPEVSPGT